MASICPQLLTSGTCSDSSCAHLHDLQFCDTCGVSITSPAIQASHFGGKRHRRMLLGREQLLHCAICDTGIMELNWESHITGKRHARAAKRQGVSTAVEGERIVTDVQGLKYCDLCRTHIREAQWGAHTLTRAHKRQERFSAFKAVVDEAERDKNGITIEGSTDFDIIAPTASPTGLSLTLVIKMIIPQSKVTLAEVNLMSTKGSRASPYVRSLCFDAHCLSKCSRFTAVIESPTRTVSYSNPIKLKATFRQSHVGRYEDRVELLFKDLQLNKHFLISRTFRAIVGNKADYHLLQPKAPYVPRERLARQPEVTVVAGVDPPSLKGVPYVFKLPKARIPKSLLSALGSTRSPFEGVKRMKNVFLPSTLNSDTYARHFKHLLWIEEFQMECVSLIFTQCRSLTNSLAMTWNATKCPVRN
jgi:helicase MOV-10